MERCPVASGYPQGVVPSEVWSGRDSPMAGNQGGDCGTEKVQPKDFWLVRHRAIIVRLRDWGF